MRSKRKMSADELARFAALHRAACADLALAEAHNLPPATVQYLHTLVSRAHNQLYRVQMFDKQLLWKAFVEDVPRAVFRDPYIQFMFVLFYGLFFFSAILAYNTNIYPGYTDAVLPPAQQAGMQESFGDWGTRSTADNFFMAGFYIWNNAGIGMRCFAMGILVVPGVLVTMFNAVYLGAAFGFMARQPEAGENFRDFVTAHAPFELTAIVLSAGIGLRLGMSLFVTEGYTRQASLIINARKSVPVIAAAVGLFVLAAMIEGFVSPTTAPYPLKVLVAIISSVAMMFYFVVLGWSKDAV
jgi:uncharacterized membrane protein SpoIIM required for sporulation